MIYGYIRVSTDKQNVANQEFEISSFCKANNMKINHWIKETISSRQPFEKRSLRKLLKKMKLGDILITSELSRLGRNLLQVMSILNYCLSNNIEVWTIKDNYRLGSDIQSKVMAFAFGLSAEIERDLISQRTKEALARIKAEGRTLGRTSGSINKRKKLNGKKTKILEMMYRGFNRNQIAKECRVSFGTIDSYIKRNVSSKPD